MLKLLKLRAAVKNLTTLRGNLTRQAEQLGYSAAFTKVLECEALLAAAKLDLASWENTQQLRHQTRMGSHNV